MAQLIFKFHKRFISYIFFFLFISYISYYLLLLLDTINGTDTVAVLENNSNCNLQNEICNVEFPAGAKLSLKITPRPIFANQKQKAILKIESTDWIPEAIDFSDTDMGYNRPTFKKTSENEYEADFILEACALDVMQWNILTLFKTKDEKQIGVPFKLQVSTK